MRVQDGNTAYKFTGNGPKTTIDPFFHGSIGAAAAGAEPGEAATAGRAYRRARRLPDDPGQRDADRHAFGGGHRVLPAHLSVYPRPKTERAVWSPATSWSMSSSVV